jgi:hypothetical protein
VRTQFNKMSKQSRAVDLPHEGFGSYFLDVFDRPPRSSACECARGSGASLSQVLHLANSNTVEGKIATGNGRVARLARDKTPPDRALDEIYLAAFARQPTTSERQLALEYIARQSDGRKALEDVVWAIINSREFLLNH